MTYNPKSIENAYLIIFTFLERLSLLSLVFRSKNDYAISGCLILPSPADKKKVLKEYIKKLENVEKIIHKRLTLKKYPYKTKIKNKRLVKSNFSQISKLIIFPHCTKGLWDHVKQYRKYLSYKKSK